MFQRLHCVRTQLMQNFVDIWSKGKYLCNELECVLHHSACCLLLLLM